MKPTLKDLARTNYLLYKLREPLEVEIEIYVKWYALNAFNGAAYKCKSGTAELSFYLADQYKGERAEDQIQIEFDGIIGLLCSKLTEVDIHKIVDIANREFTELLDKKSSAILTEIRRVQINAIFENKSLTPIKTAEILMNNFADQVDGKFIVSQPYKIFDNEQGWDIDGEIILNAPLDEKVVVEKFSKIAPVIEAQQLIGFGALCHNHEGGNFIRNELKFAHLTGRHF